MKKLKYPRTIYFDHNLKKWISFYVNNKNNTIIEKQAKRQKELIKEGYKKGNVNKLKKDEIDKYSYFIENKKSHKFDYMVDFVAHKKKLSKVLSKKYISPDELIKAEALSPKEQKQFLSKFITDDDEKFLKAMLKNPYFEKDKYLIRQKLKGDGKKEVITEHVIKRVVIYKYSATHFFISYKENGKLKRIFKDRGRIQLHFKIGSEEFFTNYFEATLKTNYETIIKKTIDKYPSKINHRMIDLKIQVV